MKRLLISSRIEFLDNAWKYFVNENYVQAFHLHGVECQGALNIIDSDALASAYDGLLICGGYDVDPRLYQAPKHEKTVLYERAVDQDDLCLLDSFVKVGKPILGICRGLQLINVYFGGTLCQHFEAQSHEESEHLHRIRTAPGSRMAALFGENAIVNSYHHQCVDKVGAHLQIGASAADGRVEALEHDSLPIIAVQWHPERLDKEPLIPYFAHLLDDKRAISPSPNEAASN